VYNQPSWEEPPKAVGCPSQEILEKALLSNHNKQPETFVDSFVWWLLALFAYLLQALPSIATLKQLAKSCIEIVNPGPFTGTIPIVLWTVCKLWFGYFITMFVYPTFFDTDTILIAGLAPFYEELTRFTIFGFYPLVQEIVTKTFIIILLLCTGYFPQAMMYLPSVVMHVVFFLVPLPFQTRWLVHFCWNYFIMSNNFGYFNHEHAGCIFKTCGLICEKKEHIKTVKPPTVPFVNSPFKKSATPNMDYYRLISQADDGRGMTYADALKKPASKCGMTILPKLDESFMFYGDRNEKRKEKMLRKKNERAMRKRLTQLARYRASLIRAEMKEESIKNRRILEEENKRRKERESDPDFIAETHPEEDREYKVPPMSSLTSDQKEKLSLVIDGLFAETPEMDVLIDNFSDTLSEGDSELLESLQTLKKGIKLEPQMLGSVTSYVKALMPTVNVGLTEETQTTADAMMNQFVKLNDALKSGPLSTGKVEIGFDFKGLLAPLGMMTLAVLFAYFKSTYPKTAIAVGLLGLVTAVSMNYGCPRLAECIKSLASAFDSMPAPVDDASVVLTSESLGTTLYSIAGPIITWTHFNMLGGTCKGTVVEKFMAASKMAKNCEDGVAYTGTTIVNFLTELFGWISDTFGFGNLRNVFDLYPELSELEKKVREMENQLFTGTLCPDKVMATALQGYRTDIMRVMSKLKPGSSAAIRASFVVKACENLYKTVSIGFAQNSVRAEPVCMNLYSIPGVGKSTVAQSFAQELLAQPGVLPQAQLEAYMRQRDNYVYCIDATQNFPDGYYSQLVTILDDWGIRRDKEGMEMDSGLTALIRWVNGMPYNIESAHLDLKGKLFANNIFMLATTNNRIVTPTLFPGFTDVNAILRRFHLSYMLSINDKYCADPKKDYEHRSFAPGISETVMVDDVPTLIVPYEAWAFVPWDLSTGRRSYGPDGKLLPVLSYDEVMELAVEKIFKARKFNQLHKATIDMRVAAAAKRATEHNATLPVLEKQSFSDVGPYSYDTGFWKGNSSAKNYCMKHKWLRDAFVEHERGTHRAEVTFDKRIEDDKAYLEYVSLVSTGPAPNKSVAGVWFKGTFVDWLKYDLARTRHPTWTAVQCAEFTFSEAIEVAAVKAGIIWNDVAEWVQTDPMKAAMYAAVPIALCALPFVYSWVKTSFFPDLEEESLKPKPEHHRRVKVALKPRVAKPPPKDAAVLIGEAGCSESMRNISNLVNNNRFDFSMSNRPGVRQCSGLGIFNRYIVMPRHFMEQFAAQWEDDKSLRLRISRTRAIQGFSFEVDWPTFHEWCIDFEENSTLGTNDIYNDRVIFQVPDNIMGSVPDIRKHLSRKSDMIWTRNRIEGVVNLITTDNLGQIEQFFDTTFQTDYKEYHYEHAITKGLFYPIKSVQGNCGSPLFAESKGVPKLIGFHIAGHAASYLAAGIVIQQEDFDFLKETPVEVGPRAMPVPTTWLEGHSGALEGTGRVLARLDEPIYSPPNSKLIKSPYHDVLEPCGKEPARLRPTWINGERVDPMIKALSNYNITRGVFNQELLDEIKYAVIKHHVKHGGYSKGALTREVAIFGDEEIKAIPKSTTLGVPLSEWKTPQYKGKTIIMGRDGEERGPRYSDYCELHDKMEHEILSGKNPSVAFKAVVKDELLSPEKVANANSRVIFAGPFPLQVFTRMYYGELSKNIMLKEYMMHNRQALGLNVYSDWDALAAFLMAFGQKRIVDFDYKKYDGSLGRQIMSAVFDIMDAMYPEATEKDKRMRKWIRDQHLNAIVLFKDLAVEFDASNTSGNSLTAIINNYANQLLVIYVLANYVMQQSNVEYQKGMIDFDVIDANLRMCTLGDDVIMALGPLFDGITTADFAKILRPVNINITNGDKTDPILNPKPLRTIFEVTFLKRSFRRVYGRFVAPLDQGSISKMIQWTKKDTEKEELDNVIQDAIYEISLHGKTRYEECMKTLEPAMYKQGVAPKHSCWEDTFHRALEKECTWEG